MKQPTAWQTGSNSGSWPDQTPVAGQQFEYTFDDIGNRTQTKAGGDQNGANQRPANYGANTLNQYTNRDVPAAFDVVGVGLATNTVTVNSQTTYRKGEYFRYQVPVSNGSAAVWQSVTVHETGQTDVSGNVFVPKNQELFYYDLDGNLTQDGRWIYAWDAENRLISLTPSTSVGPQISLKFEYDWQGRRIHKQVWDGANWNGSITNDVKFVYDGWNLVAELNALNASTLLRSYVWGLDLSGSPQGAGGVGGLLKVQYNGAQATNCFVAFDGNGNVSALVNAADGSAMAQYEYGPFGEVIRATGPMARANPFRFSTKYQDDETDLLYYGKRYLNTVTGRWWSKDPAEETGGQNLYAFVRNSPINNFDALGLAEASGKVDDPDAYDVGWEWLLGTPNTHRQFKDGDKMTEELRRSGTIQASFEKAKAALRERCKTYDSKFLGPYPVDASGDASYRLGGWTGPFKYARDYSVIATGERFGGNLTVAFLGSFFGRWTAKGDCCAKVGRVDFYVKNYTSLGSGTRFPITGYWPTNYTASLYEIITLSKIGIPSGIFSSVQGENQPMATVDQTFNFHEDIRF
jgi:RHS repeat-associated protein